MSGFFGMIRDDGQPVDPSFLEKIAQALSFRGPDGTSFWAREAVGGCFTLMRTGPALQAECQPVVLDKGFWLWGDVRLDDRLELQTQLGELHANPEETSENLLLRASRKWGPGALERASGDFSFVFVGCRRTGSVVRQGLRANLGQILVRKEV